MITTSLETTILDRIRTEIQRCSESTEGVYTRLGEIFPSLLAIVSDTDPESSLPALKDLVARIRDGLSSTGDDATDFFDGFNDRNARLFTELSERMNSLDGIHERLEAIRANSEELELISLNAMVISIKSGENGRAFSCITENLKRLSASMISLSNELMVEEKKLLEKNAGLERSFSVARERREQVDREKAVSVQETILPAMNSAWEDLTIIEEKAGTAVRPIRQAMNGIQLQDIVRQSIDQVILAIQEIVPLDTQTDTEDQLDRISVDIQLLELCGRIIDDVHANVLKSIAIFSENWESVNGVLDEVELLRKRYIATYFDYTGRGNLSLPYLLEKTVQSFSGFIAKITVFQREQKGMVQNSASIVTEVKYLRTLFETIRPIIARLQHVRITQQIEVAKNEALHSVRGTVEHMSELIYRTEDSVEETRKELEAFIESIESVTRGYGEDTKKDSRELDRIKEEKSTFFKLIQNDNEQLTTMLSDIHVYPDSFQLLCREVDDALAVLRDIAVQLETLKKGVLSTVEKYQNQRDELLGRTGSDNWVIKNDRLRELVERFTITAHKEAAGMIGGFSVEQNDLSSIESGDVTLFF